jgi:hypothetical protein
MKYVFTLKKMHISFFYSVGIRISILDSTLSDRKVISHNYGFLNPPFMTKLDSFLSQFMLGTLFIQMPSFNNTFCSV